MIKPSCFNCDWLDTDYYHEVDTELFSCGCVPPPEEPQPAWRASGYTDIRDDIGANCLTWVPMLGLGETQDCP